MSSETSATSSAKYDNSNNTQELVELTVKCGAKVGIFYPSKFKKNGKTVAKCIKYQWKWVSPSEFETLAGVQARKWKQSIKYGGKPLGGS